MAGLVVEVVEPGSVAERAGVMPGDRLTGWRRAASPPANPAEAAGQLTGGLDLFDLQEEHQPRGQITLLGERHGSSRTWPLTAGDWGLSVRPEMPAAVAAEVRAAAAMEPPEASTAFGQLAERLAETDPGLAVWLWFRSAGKSIDARRWAEVVAAFDRGAEVAAALGDRAAEARLRAASGFASRHLADSADGWAKLTAAQQLWAELPGAALRQAFALDMMGQMASTRRDYAAAETSLLESLKIKRREAPGSLQLARTLSLLGKVVASRGELERAEPLMEEALEIRRRLDPEGVDLAHSLSGLGTLRAIRGDAAGAEAPLRRALARFEVQDPKSRNVATILNNLGVLAANRGDLVGAEGFYRRSLELAEAADPDGLDVSLALNNLGSVARQRGDLERAEELGARALEIRRQQAPSSLDVAVSLTNLANIAADRGDYSVTRGHLEEALGIQEVEAPASLEVARTANNLGMAALRLGDLAEADRRLRLAESLYRRLAPRRYELGSVWKSRGDLARQRGDLAAAEKQYAAAVALLGEVAPGTQVEADALWGLARVLAADGREDEAETTYRRAETALEAQQGRLGGSQEVRARYRARYQELYREHLELLLRLGLPEGAFETLERSRARLLLALLAERDLVFSEDLSADLDAARRRAAVAVDRAQQQLLGAPPGASAEQVASLVAKLTEAQRQQQEVAARVRAASPRLAALAEPRPLSFAAARSALDPGTVALAYSLGVEGGEIFVLAREKELRVEALPAGLEELRRQVERLRQLLEAGASEGFSAIAQAALTDSSRQLYDQLIAPVEPHLVGAERLLLVPDGPLSLLPFAALDSGAGEAERRFLGTSRPLFTAASLTVWAELRKRRGVPHGSSEVAIFADPELPFGESPIGGPSDAVLRSLEWSKLSRLPGSRQEALAIGRRFGDARTFFGAAASEAQARSTARQASTLHFAVHGYVDERFPLSSGLVLAADPAGEGAGNGLLQAWEVFEGVRTEADLVVLSACETALGEEVSGEGLLGLTRAFQYAGARAVMASLWRVSDRSTAALMDRFYGALAAGLPAAEALVEARRQLVGGPVSPPAVPVGWWQRLGLSLGWRQPPPPVDYSHPWHWAGFRLDGDWR